MELFGIYISYMSGLWIAGFFGILYLSFLFFIWCMLDVASRADDMQEAQAIVIEKEYKRAA